MAPLIINQTGLVFSHLGVILLVLESFPSFSQVSPSALKSWTCTLAAPNRHCCPSEECDSLRILAIFTFGSLYNLSVEEQTSFYAAIPSTCLVFSTSKRVLSTLTALQSCWPCNRRPMKGLSSTSSECGANLLQKFQGLLYHRYEVSRNSSSVPFEETRNPRRTLPNNLTTTTNEQTHKLKLPQNAYTY